MGNFDRPLAPDTSSKREQPNVVPCAMKYSRAFFFFADFGFGEFCRIDEKSAKFANIRSRENFTRQSLVSSPSCTTRKKQTRGILGASKLRSRSAQEGPIVVYTSFIFRFFFHQVAISITTLSRQIFTCFFTFSAAQHRQPYMYFLRARSTLSYTNDLEQ